LTGGRRQDYGSTTTPAAAGRISFREAIEMKPVFIQLQCLPGKTYEVADALYELEIASELYSTSGEYDLLMKLYIDPEQDEDIGRLINDRISAIPGIVRTLTTLTFKAF
jgi:DNA-binding Lrp family transcriptional regulator